MHLVGALCADRPSAAAGHATIHRRGTSLPATTYTTFAGGGASAPATHALDGYGIAVRYVNELVDVTVYNASGTKVLGPFTDGDNATAVEIVHAHVTGTDYTTGQSALNKPSTLQLQLDRRYTSFGADDFQVMVGGSARNLKDVLQDGVIDVTGPTYGAMGDDTANDTNAITAAYNAAVAAGGGTLYFPPGTYKFAPSASAAAIAISAANIRFLGAGPGASILKVYGTSDQRLLQLNAGATSFTAENLGFAEDSLVGTTCILINAPTASTLGRFINCAVTKSQTAGYAIKFDDGELQFIGCELTHPSGSSNPFLGADQANPAGGITVSGGKIVYAGTASQGFCYTHTGGYLHFSNVVVRYTRAASSDIFLYHDVGTGQVLVAGCRFSTAGGTLHMNGIGAHTSFLTESGCVFGSNVIFKDAPVSSTVREHRAIRTSTSATSYAVGAENVVNYASHEVVSSGAGMAFSNPFGTLPSTAGMMLPLFIRYKNTSGGAITPTFGTQFKASSVSVANNEAAGWVFQFEPTLGCFVQYGSPVSYAS